MSTVRIEEQLRRVAARSTKEIVLRRGAALGMYVGCGYPKSGTVWLCQLMSTYLGVPYPREYRSPIAMASVIHAHWRYDPRIPASAYITRDGRDVLLSLYHFYVRAMTLKEKPRRARWVQELFRSLYGDGFDPYSVRENLPRFIEHEARSPRGSEGLAWHQHVADWRRRPGIVQISYEGLLADPVDHLSSAMEAMTGTRDDDLARLAVDRWTFARSSGRRQGDEDRTSFLRKGVAGDWVSEFSREAGELYDSIAGDALVELGYAKDRNWWATL